MSEATLMGDGSAPNADPVVQAITELDAHVSSLPEEKRAEFSKLDPAARVAALGTARQEKSISEYAGKLTAEQRAEFDKLKPEEKTAAVGTAKQTAAYVEALKPEERVAFEKLKPEERTAKIAESVKSAEAAGKIPDKYEFKLPEGFKLDEEGVKSADAIFRELKLPQGAAQKLMNQYVSQIQKATTAGQQQLAAQEKAWRDEFTKDPAHKEILANAKRALSTLGDKDTATLVTNSWLGNHPGLIRLLAKAGELAGEDKTVHGKGGEGDSTAGKSIAQIIYKGLP
jgi:hypothetical protein